MHVQFDTNEISKRDALCLMALLENIAGVEVPLHIVEKDAVRHPSAQHPESLQVTQNESHRGYKSENQALKDRAVEEHEKETVKRKPGRPRKEQVDVRPTDAAVAAGPTPSEETTAGSVGHVEKAPDAETPITIEALRDIFNEHVSRHDMPSALQTLGQFGCKRVTDFMNLDAPTQGKVLAALAK